MSNEPSTKTMKRSWPELFTTSTTTLFLVVAITGIMLLFGVAEGVVKSAHEWLGLVFVAGAVAHGVYHWRSMLAYARRPILWIVTAATVLATVAFVVPSQSARGPNPMRATIEMVGEAPLERIALLMNTESGVLENKLRNAGIEIEGTAQTLKDIERDSGRRMPELLAIITQK